MHCSLFWGLIVVYLLLDLFISTTCLGFYQSFFSFNSSSLISRLSLEHGYHPTSSAIEFVLLASFRCIYLLVTLLCLFAHLSTHHINLVLLGVQICNLSFSLVKILAFSELPEQLGYTGVWMSLVWNVASFLGLWCLWKIVLAPAFALPLPGQEYVRLHAQSLDTILLNGNSTETTTTTTPRPVNSPLRASTWSHIILLVKYCLHYWVWLLAGFFFLIVYSIARIFIPMYTAKVIALIVASQDKQQLNLFFQAVTIMAVLTVISTVFGGLRGGCFSYNTSLIKNRIRKDLFRSITRQEIAFFDQAQTGEILSRLTTDCETIAMTLSTNVNVFLRNVLMVAGSLILMIAISWRLTLVTFIAIPPIAFFTKIYSIYFEKVSEETQTTVADGNRVAEEVISSMRTVRSFACESRECARFEDNLENTLTFCKKKSIAYMGFVWLNELANNLILIAVLCYGGYLVLTHKLSTDGIIAFMLYQMQLGENFYNINSVFSGLMESVGASRKVFAYLHRQPQIPYNGTLMAAVEGKIEFMNVSFTYPSRPNYPVLKDISFRVQPGETVALVGPSGAGKSSIISLLEHFYETDDGEVMLDNVLIKRYDHGYYHQKVALVAQEPTLYAGSVRYNILYGCEEEVSEQQMIEAAKLANVHDFIMETELGYDTKCGEKGIQMSGGQKQRIAIARALVRKPVVLILDEATSALDAESEHIIQEAIQKCSVGRTVVVIAHRLSTVEKANRILVIDKGKLVQSGNHQSLMLETEGLYNQLVQRQLLNAEPEETAQTNCRPNELEK